MDEITDPVLIIHNLHLFLEVPETVQALQNGISRWKALENAIVMVAPVIGLRSEIEKFFHQV